MKHFKNYFMLLAVCGLLMTSCSQEDESVPNEESTAILTFGPALNDMLKKASAKQALPACSDDNPSYAEISLTYDETELDLQVPILVDDNGFFTAYHDKLEIPVTSGDFVTVTVTDFSVFDADDDLIWMAPLEGSDYEDFVSDALPITINLRAGTKNYQDVEVLCFDDREVNRYGYQFFDILPKKLYELCVFANYCVPGGRDRVANYDLDLYYFFGDEAEGNPINNPELYSEIYSDESPITGPSGDTFYADPVCVAVPGPQDGEEAGELYLYYEISLEDWQDSYGTAPDLVQTGYLSWTDIQALLEADEDETTVDYLHFFFNCPDRPQDPTCILDADEDGVNNCLDQCPGFNDNLDSDEDGLPNGCDTCPYVAMNDDSDNDCRPNNEDPCPNDPTNQCGNGDGDVLEKCETAYMEGDISFQDPQLNLGSNNWGWAHFEDDGIVQTSFALWAGAGQNNTSAGYYIGDVYVEIIPTADPDDGDAVDVSIDIDVFDGNQLDGVHIYFSDDVPKKSAPGSYGNNFDPDVDGLSYDFSDADGDFWFIVHADACPSED